jgi:hypothetical protein
LVTTILRKGGEGEPRVGKSSKLSTLNQLTTSGEASVGNTKTTERGW